MERICDLWGEFSAFWGIEDRVGVTSIESPLLWMVLPLFKGKKARDETKAKKTKT